MANTPKNGTSYLVRTATGASNAFETLVCLTSNGFQTSGSDITTDSKCTGEWSSTLQGRKGWTLSGEGQSIAGTADTGTASFQKLAILWKAGTIFAAEFYNVDDEDDVIRGNVRITDLAKTAPDNDVTTFSVTFTGQGEVFFTPAA
jgi:predicted secreted protein